MFTRFLRLFPSFLRLEAECADAHTRATRAEDEVRFWRDKAAEYERLFLEERRSHSTTRECLEDWLAMQHTGYPIHNRAPQLPREPVDLSPPEPQAQKVLARDFIRKEAERRFQDSVGATLQELDELTRATA